LSAAPRPRNAPVDGLLQPGTGADVICALPAKIPAKSLRNLVDINQGADLYTPLLDAPPATGRVGASPKHLTDKGEKAAGRKAGWHSASTALRRSGSGNRQVSGLFDR
jgi:hypothetical protein